MKKFVVFLLGAFTLALFLSVNRSCLADGEPLHVVGNAGASVGAGTSTDSANFIFNDLASEVLWSRESGGGNNVRTGKPADYRIVPDFRGSETGGYGVLARRTFVDGVSFSASGGLSANRYHVFALRKIRI